MFFFLHNFTLITEVIINQKSLLVTELNKFGVTGLVHFHKGILPCHMAKASVCLEGYVLLYKRKRLIYRY